MKTLETSFRKYGYEFELVKRSNNAAIFAQKSEGAVIAHEVIVIQNFSIRTLFNRILEAGEYYPGTEKWGSDGFTCTSLAKAEEKMQWLENRQKERELNKVPA